MTITRALYFVNRVKDGTRRRMLITSLVNGFDFAALNGDDRNWLRKRRLVNRTGDVTEKGRNWARHFLAVEADELVGKALDFNEE